MLAEPVPQVASYACGSGDKQLALAAGDYALEFYGTNEAFGAYSFEVIAVPDPQAFSVAVPFKVSDGVPAAGAGKLETKPSRDVYRFSVPTGGQSVYLDVLSCPYWMTWKLTGSTGAQVASYACGSGDKQLALAAGDYALEFYGTNRGVRGVLV